MKNETIEKIQPATKPRAARLRDANMTDLHAAIYHLTNACDSFEKEQEKENCGGTKISDEIHECFDEVGYAMVSISKALSRIIYN